jgi:hypothetical protein
VSELKNVWLVPALLCAITSASQGFAAIGGASQPHGRGATELKNGVNFWVHRQRALPQIKYAAVANSLCPYGSSLPDGCLGAQAHGLTPADLAHWADLHKVIAVSIVPGSGYKNGTGYAWISTGGGCSTAARGTIDVVNGALTNAVVNNEGAGCTSLPMIAIPSSAGSGIGGYLVPTVYQANAHNATITWNIPGIDYPVGYDTTLSLKDPTISSNLPSCANWESSSNALYITASNCTINGFDFSVTGGSIVVGKDLSNITISNNRFKVLSTSGPTLYLIQHYGGTCGGATGYFKIKYNEFDGNAPAGTAEIGSSRSNAPDPTMTDAVTMGCTDGSMIFEYNYCVNIAARCLDVASASNAPTTVSVTDNYNVFYGIGTCYYKKTSGNCFEHGEADYFYGGNGLHPTYNPVTVQNNFYLIPPKQLVLNSLYQFTDTAATATMDAATSHIANPTVQFNHYLVPGASLAKGSNNSPVVQSASASVFCGHQGGGSVSGVIRWSSNYIDYTGAYFPYNTDKNTCGTDFPGIADINAVTGNSCNTTACN